MAEEQGVSEDRIRDNYEIEETSIDIPQSVIDQILADHLVHVVWDTELGWDCLIGVTHDANEARECTKSSGDQCHTESFRPGLDYE